MSANLPAALNRTLDAMKDVAVSIDSSMGDFNYLKLSKAGEWLHGADEDEVSPDSVFAVGLETFFVGFQAWDEGDLLGEEIRLITEPPLTRADLKDVGAEWKPLIGFQLVCVDGPDKGLQLVYKTTAKGGIKEVNKLMKTIVASIGDQDGSYPLVALDTDSYKHKKYGKIYTPLLEIVGWTDEMPDFNDADTPAADADADDDDEPVVEPDQPEPQRRRRRRA